KLTPGDIEFLRSHLNKQEQILFYRMPAMDQKHCLNTAYTAAQILPNSQKINQKMLTKIALLHDVGKVAWPPSVLYRVWSTLIDLLLPPFANVLAKFGKKQKSWKICRALFIKKEHGPLGATLLKDLNWGEGPLYIISHHHNGNKDKKILELDLLKQADEQN
ncbi:MAG: HD domain-containing protein, partial [Candidatus Margulisbacteria bacterium]|nr:HD domain-containing protein [Candidatus Margulisiibacteriota bacterium]